MSNINTKRNLEIVKLLMKGWTEREIAHKFSIRPSRVSRIKQDVLDRVARNYGVSPRSLPRQTVHKS